MRILMLGWEFPPFVAGGLGTACQGLTKALDGLGHEILFILPRALDMSGPGPQHLSMLGARGSVAGRGVEGGTAEVVGGARDVARRVDIPGFERTSFWSIPSTIMSPYPGQWGGGGGADGADMMEPISMDAPPLAPAPVEVRALREAGVSERTLAEGPGDGWGGAPGQGYGPDVVGDTERYAKLVLDLARGRPFDVVHAHDWTSFPAGIAVARASGRPLVAHVHATEFDRSGEHIDQRVYDIERRGAHMASRVVAVSKYTRDILVGRYGVDREHIDVVYNGVEGEVPEGYRELRVGESDKVVLFLGRITMQKGPEYFVRAARRVLEKEERVKFVVAGAGDMARRMVEEAAFLGIGHRMLFTGFLRGPDVDRAFRMADCYVMPSVSEPFGIAPLEAMRNDVPVIISKQSGVSEVLTHALKVDFWDIDEMANKILAVIRRPALSQTLRQNQPQELRSLTWETAAKRVVASYGAAIAAASAAASAVPVDE